MQSRANSLSAQWARRRAPSGGVRSAPRGLRPAFSLIELLLAVALSGMILTAASGFLFSVANLWLQSETLPVFDEHVENVTQFLEQTFDSSQIKQSSGLSQPQNQSQGESSDDAANNPGAQAQNNTGNQQSGGGSRSGDQEPGIAWKTMPGTSTIDDEVLSFKISGDLPLFYVEDTYLPEMTCYLLFEEEKGLLLRWQTAEMANEDQEDLNETIVSPLVTSMTYHYYDSEDDSWTESEEMEEADDGSTQLPDFIKFVFTHEDGRTKESFILVPNLDANVPLF